MRSKAQAFIELAIAIPLFLIVIIGIFDLGRIFFAMITLVSAAREGARYVSVYPYDLTNDTGSFYNTKQIAIQEAAGSGIVLSDDRIVVTCTNSDENDEACDGGSPVVVIVSYDFNLILGWGLSDTITITRSAEMIVP